MQDLRVTLVQANQKWEDKQANFKNYEALLENISTDIILLPEMFQTGFSMQTELLAETWDSSESVIWLKKMAAKRNAAIYTSLIIKDGSYYNRGVFITPDGNVSVYDKRKTFTLAKEHQYFDSGNKETIVEYKDWKLQLQICYDLRFPEIVRNRMEQGKPAYDAILYVANWPSKRASHWKSLLQARAIENQCYVLAANRVGIDKKGLEYSGDSCMIDAGGAVQLMKPSQELCSSFVLKTTDLRQIREMLPFLCDA